MTTKGWDACVQVLRHQPPHLRPRELDVIFWWEQDAALEQEMALMRNVLPVLLDRKLFPTLTKLCIANGKSERQAWLLGLLEKSNVHTLTLYGFGVSDGIPPQLMALLASGRAREFTYCPGDFQSLLAVASHVLQAPMLERFAFFGHVNSDADSTACLEPFIAAMTSAESRALKHLTAGIKIGRELRVLDTSASPGAFSSCPLWSHSLPRAIVSAGSLPTICWSSSSASARASPTGTLLSRASSWM